MFFQKKIDKSMKSIKNKNTDEIDFDEHFDPKAEWEEEQNPVKLEKGDLLPLIISGFIVFSPVFIVLIIILIWASN